jgi:ribosomal protein S18 acetylase RimI-like enzyme
MEKPIPHPNFDPHNLIIRKVTKADLPALEWDGEYTKYRRMFANLYHESQNGRTILWIVTQPAGEILGQVFVMLKSSERQAADGHHRAYIFAFRVKSAWRNLGIGKTLMEFVESNLRNQGFKFVTLNVAKENQGALRLYQQLGYKIIGSRTGDWTYRDHEGHLQHVHEPAWRMIKGLREG